MGKLRTQVFGILFVLFCIAGFSIVYLNLSLLKGTLELISREQAEHYALQTSNFIRNLLVSEDYKLEYLAENQRGGGELSRFLANIPDLISLDVFDRQDSLIYHYPLQRTGPLQRDLLNRVSNSREAYQEFYTVNEQGSPVKAVRSFALFEKNKIQFESYRPLLKEGEIVGVIYLSLDFSRIPRLLKLMGLGNFLLALIFILTAYLAISLWGENAINRPIKMITSAQEKLGKGDFYAEVSFPLTPTNELAQVSNSFNRMVRELRTFKEELQKKTENLQTLNELYHKLNRQLEEKVEEKTREMKDFFSIVTHDLKVPLAAIKGYTDLLLKDGDEKISGRKRLFLKSIALATASSLLLLRNMMEVVKYEAGKISYDMEEFDLREVIREVKRQFELALEEKNIQFSYRIPDYCCKVYGDKNKIRQVFLNLINNSLSFTPKEGSIEILCRSKEDRVEVQVKDTGSGIPPEQISTVFEKFTASSLGGSGLGLYIVKRILDDHKQTITIESQPEQGSSFTFTLSRIPLTLQ